MKNEAILNEEELLKGARAAFSEPQWDEFWKDFDAAAQARAEKTKELAEPRNLNTTY